MLNGAYYVECRDKPARSLDPEQTATTGAVVYGFTLLTQAMRGSRNFCQWGSRPDCQKTALTAVFFRCTVVYQWFISKKTLIFQGFSGGPTFSRWGPTFSRGVQLFPGGCNFFQGGLNAYLYRNP